MNTMKDHKLKIPDNYNHLQTLLQRIDDEIQMFGCTLEQTQFSDPPWQYVIKDRIFKVKDIHGSGLGIKFLKQRYKFEEIIEENEASAE